MEQLSFLQRLEELFKIILSSKAFIALFIVFLLTIILLVISFKTKKKIIKTIFALIYIGVVAYIVYKYGNSILNIGDGLVDKIFTTLYFPNYISYVCMLIISALLFIMTIINNNVSKVLKITSIGSFILIIFLFILTIDTINSSSIDIYNKASIYSSDILIVLIQSSMGIFAFWFAVLIVDAIVSAIVKKESREEVTEQIKKATTLEVTTDENKKTEKTVEDFKVLTDQSFYESYSKFAKKDEYDDYFSIIDKQ